MSNKFDLAMLNRLLMTGWRRRQLLLAPFAVLPLLGLIIGIIAPRVYESHMSILIQDIDNNPVVQDLAVQTNLRDRMDGLSVLLQSHLLVNVIDALKLVPKDAPDTERMQKLHELSQEVSAKLIGKDLVELKMRARDPSRMVEILTAAADRFIGAIRAPAKSSMANDAQFLENRLKDQKTQLEAAEAALADYRNNHSDQLPELHSNNIQRLGQLKDQLQEKKTQLAGAEATSQALRSRLSQSNPIIGKLDEQIVEVSGELAMLRAKYTDEHSAVQGAMHQLERLQEERSKLISQAKNLSSEDMEQLWNRASSMPSNIQQPNGDMTSSNGTGAGAGNNGAPGAMPNSNGMEPLLISQLTQLQQAEAKVTSLKREIDALTPDVADLEAKTAAFGEVDRQLNALDREVKTQRDQYDSLTKRFETARLTVDLGDFQVHDQIKVIDLPNPPVTVNWPLIVYLLAGIFAAGALGVSLSFVAETLDGSVRGVAQLERLIKAPVLSTIPMLQDDSLVIPGIGDLAPGQGRSRGVPA